MWRFLGNKFAKMEFLLSTVEKQGLKKMKILGENLVRYTRVDKDL